MEQYMEYYHHDLSKGFIESGKDRVLGEAILPIDGRGIIVVQKVSQIGHEFVVVPGFVVDLRYKKTVLGRDISRVEIVSEKERSTLEQKIREAGFKGSINFSR